MARNPDQIRQDILEYLLSVRDAAKNEHMLAQPIQMIQNQLRTKKYSPEDVTGELLYLVEQGFVNKKTRLVKMPQHLGISKEQAKALSYKQDLYGISAKGTDHLRGETKFSNHTSERNIHIGQVSGGAVVIGNFNKTIVNQENIEAYKILTQIEDAVRNADSVDGDRKLDYLGDIATIKGQLAKKNPNKTIIQEAWNIMTALATLEGVSQLVEQLRPMIDPMLR